jgi:hypothetical protein
VSSNYVGTGLNRVPTAQVYGSESLFQYVTKISKNYANNCTDDLAITEIKIC